MKRFFFLFFCLTSLLNACKDQPTSSEIVEEAVEKGSVTIMEAIEPSESDIPVLVGTYTREEGHVNGQAKGIHLCYLNTETGTLRYANTFEAGINPSYLAIHPSGKFVYAVNESGGRENEEFGGVTALSVDENNNLAVLNRRSTGGDAPCHVSLSNQGTHVLVANYGSGSVTSFAISLDGKLSGAQNLIRFKGSGATDRQTAPHAHFIQQLKSKEIISSDLGTDSLRFFSFERGQLESTDQYLTLTPGSGPRHIASSFKHNTLYVVNELSGSITCFQKDAEGTYKNVQELSTLPEENDGNASCAAIKISPDQKHLYVSNRGDYNNIAIFEIDEEGQLMLISHQSTLGNVPRDIAISPDGQHLIAANQNSNNLVSFSIDKDSGLLKSPKILENLATPVCVKFF